MLRLARQSWSFNSKMGLTGTLRLVDGEFSEVIEGPCEVVQPLAARILGAADDRLADRVEQYARALEEQVEEKNRRLKDSL